jgi:F-type H+-transporting ATPase subunit b
LIAAKLADADKKEAEGQKARDAFQQKNDAFDKQRAALMSKATDAAAAEGHKLLGDAREAADALSAKRQEALRSEALSLNQAIRRRTQQEVFAIARRALTDLAGASLEDRMADVLIRRLQTMDGKVKETFALALKTASGPALVRSAFALPEIQRAAIETSFHQTFSTHIQIRFETAPDLVSGIEFTANGQKIGWSIADYLGSLQKGVGDLLKARDKPQPKPASKPAAKARVAAKTKARSGSKAKEPKVKAARR